jgi:hypothetical protein
MRHIRSWAPGSSMKRPALPACVSPRSVTCPPSAFCLANIGVPEFGSHLGHNISQDTRM